MLTETEINQCLLAEKQLKEIKRLLKGQTVQQLVKENELLKGKIESLEFDLLKQLINE